MSEDSATPEPADLRPKEANRAPLLLCRKCGKPIRPGSDVPCPWCVQAKSHAERVQGAWKETLSLHRIFWAFGLLVVGNLIASLLGPDSAEEGLTLDQQRQYLIGLSVFQVFSTIVVVVQVVWHFAEVKLSYATPNSKQAAIFLSVPLLIVMLIVNVGYHGVVFWISGAQPLRAQVASAEDFRWWVFVCHCVHPAIVEELFFRGVVLGAFSRFVGFGTAAFASSCLFAAVHTGTLYSFPALWVMGMLLAWLRWHSGSLLLPMLIHFLHNLAIDFL